MKYLSVDTETGGIGLDKSLLSATFICVDDEFIQGNNKFSDLLDLTLRPKDEIFTVTPEALRINRIDISKITKENTLTYEEGGTLLFRWLQEQSLDGKEKLVPLGKNIYFDLTHIWNNLIRRATWEHFCSYRLIDLSGITELYRLQGKLPFDISGSLKSLADHYKIEYDQHTARGDSWCNIRVFSKMVQS